MEGDVLDEALVACKKGAAAFGAEDAGAAVLGQRGFAIYGPATVRIRGLCAPQVAAGVEIY
jgi:hypothetical protein